MRRPPPLHLRPAAGFRLLAAAAVAWAASSVLLTGPAGASDDKAFADLKARYEKAAKKHDDDGIRERRKLILEFFDHLGEKACRKLLREALASEDSVDTRVVVMQVLGATGDPKDIDLIVKDLARDKMRGPVIALGEGIACTAPDAAAVISAHALELAAKAKGDLRLSLFEGVGELADPSSYAPLLALGEKWLPEEHFLRSVALGACGKQMAVAGLAADAGAATTPVIRFGAVLGLARTGAPESLQPLTEALHKLEPRTVEAAAVALGAAKHKPAAGALVDALATAPLRVKYEIRKALAAIFGKDVGLSADAWRAVIAGTKPEPAAVAATEPKLPDFFGTPVASDRVAIVLDVSRSMVWNDRLKCAQDGIAKYLGSLDAAASFSLFTCARTTESFSKGPSSGEQSHFDAVTWMRKQLTSGGFDLKAALFNVLAESPETDTILLATDSLPWGENAAETAMEVIEIFRRANTTRRVRLHVALTVPGGRFTTSEDLGDYEDREALLKLLAETSGGTFVRVDK